MSNNSFSLLTTNERRLYLLAILDFDEVPEAGRLDYLMRTCGLSRYLAERVLNGHYPRDVYKLFDITDALDVDFEWLMVGWAAQYHPRTLRIHLQQVKHYPKEATDQMLRLMVGVCAGHKKARDLAKLACNGKMSMLSAAHLF